MRFPRLRVQGRVNDSEFSCTGLVSLGIFSLSLFFLIQCSQAFSQNRKSEEPKVHVSRTHKEVRILTINAWSGLTYRGFFKMGQYPNAPEKRYALLVSGIRQLAPDIVAIQEANLLPQYAKRLAADLGYEAIYSIALGGIRLGPFGIPTNLREGSVILVKKPWTIVKLGRRRLSGAGIATNWFCFHFGDLTEALLARAEVNGEPLYIYAVHLRAGPFRGPALEAALDRLSEEFPQEKVEQVKRRVEKDIDRRKTEIRRLINFIDETLPTGMPAILVGDFNTTIESGELEPLLAGGRWVDSFRFKNPYEKGATWDPQHNPNCRRREILAEPYDILRAFHDSYPHRIDFILVNNRIPPDHTLDSRVVLTPESDEATSDHYGVITTLEW